jgi:hypothetical protein
MIALQNLDSPQIQAVRNSDIPQGQVMRNLGHSARVRFAELGHSAKKAMLNCYVEHRHPLRNRVLLMNAESGPTDEPNVVFRPKQVPRQFTGVAKTAPSYQRTRGRNRRRAPVVSTPLMFTALRASRAETY